MKEYDHKKIEKKWQATWDKSKIYQAQDKSKKPKFYGLIEFPYPSGAGLHVGHIRSNTAMDVISRKKRMQDFNVLYPIGWDAFGLPTENYAIKTGIHPIKVTKQNTDTFRKQLKSLGFSFDWSREVNTTDPKYYKWTQWIFLQFFKKGLAYKKRTEINWCPKDKIGLANEEVVGGMCERCGGPTEKREKEQWMLAITKYADRLDKDLDDVDFLEKIKIQQRNWIGKSEGMLFTSPVKDTNLKLQTFSAHFEAFRADTFVVIAPDHTFLKELVKGTPDEQKVLEFSNDLVKERLNAGYENKEAKGIFTGRYIVDPVGNGDLPIWVASYALADYGTGIIKCSAHDERDLTFAKKYNIKLKEVIVDGLLTEPAEFKGQEVNKARRGIIEYLEKNKLAERKTTYKLRDWIFSRQRYWGEPIPLINCEKCGFVAVPDKDLPVKLPNVAKYKPTDNGESPLADIKTWVNVKCPQCKGKAKRETDTMPNWAGSSWYYLRYADTKNNKEFASKKNLDYWLGVDPTTGMGGVNWYNGGMEHTTLHLLYSRFWHKFLYDLKLVPTSEPYAKRTSHGLILADDGTKFSKSKGNGVDPNDVIKIYGADAVRLYEMFMGPFDQAVAWDTNGIVGPYRFLERVWKLSEKISKSSHFSVVKSLNKTIKKVTEDIEAMRFNTAISSMMILSSDMEKVNFTKEDYKKFLQILAPFAPHITEELWANLGEKKSIHISDWSKWEESLIVDTEVKIIIQVNGKVRAEMMVSVDASEESVKEKALADETVVKYLAGGEPKKIIYVKGRLINIVI